eukprot:GHVU01187289.1.p2 GENE.GHVU01187289.1~~GHVU01187289.1.p2  ORF type:complete len:101 (+),score=7.25 GHVU01187289.1:421-723(+)
MDDHPDARRQEIAQLQISPPHDRIVRKSGELTSELFLFGRHRLPRPELLGGACHTRIEAVGSEGQNSECCRLFDCRGAYGRMWPHRRRWKLAAGKYSFDE